MNPCSFINKDGALTLDEKLHIQIVQGFHSLWEYTQEDQKSWRKITQQCSLVGKIDKSRCRSRAIYPIYEPGGNGKDRTGPLLKKSAVIKRWRPVNQPPLSLLWTEPEPDSS